MHDRRRTAVGEVGRLALERCPGPRSSCARWASRTGRTPCSPTSRPPSARRSRLAVVGPNGVGKSTLLAPARRRPDARDRAGHARARRPRRSCCCRRSATGGPARRCGEYLARRTGVAAADAELHAAADGARGRDRRRGRRLRRGAGPLARARRRRPRRPGGRRARPASASTAAAARPRDDHALRRPAGPVRRWPASCSPRSTSCCSTSRPTTSTSTGLALLEAFLRRPRRRRWWSSRTTARSSSAVATEVLEIDEFTHAGARVFGGGFAAYLEERERRPGGRARRRTRPTTSSAARWSTGPAGRRSGRGRARPGRPARRRGPTSRTRTSARQAGRRAVAQRPPAGRPVRAARPARGGRGPARAVGAAAALDPATRGRRRRRRARGGGRRPRRLPARAGRPARRAGASASRSPAPTARARRRCSAALLGRLPLSSGRPGSGRSVVVGEVDQVRRTLRRRRAAGATRSGPRPVRTRPRPAPCSRSSASAPTTCCARSAIAVAGRAHPGRPGAADGPRRQPAGARRADQPPRPRRRSSSSRRRSRRTTGRCCSSATTGGCWSTCAPTGTSRSTTAGSPRCDQDPAAAARGADLRGPLTATRPRPTSGSRPRPARSTCAPKSRQDQRPAGAGRGATIGTVPAPDDVDPPRRSTSTWPPTRWRTGCCCARCRAPSTTWSRTCGRSGRRRRCGSSSAGGTGCWSTSPARWPGWRRSGSSPPARSGWSRTSWRR